MDAIKPVVKGSTDTLLRTDRANALNSALSALQLMKVRVGGEGTSNIRVDPKQSILTISRSDLIAALPTGAGINVTVSPNPPVNGTGKTGDIWIQTGSTVVTSMSAAFLKIEGDLVLNQVFGYFSPANNAKIVDVQIFAQRAPTGADAIFALVDGSGTPTGDIFTLPAGQSGVALRPSINVPAGAVRQLKITQIGSSVAGAYVGLSINYQPA